MVIPLEINSVEAADLELLAAGAYSPLRGFMGEREYLSVLESMRLPSGAVWTIPIVLSASSQTAAKFSPGDEVPLLYQGRSVGTLLLGEKFQSDPLYEARTLCRTDERIHPGVGLIRNRNEILLAGPVRLRQSLFRERWGDSYISPEQSRSLILARGFRTVVGFQTRNPIHRAHKYIQKCALETLDALYIHPLVGETRPEDIPVEVRMECYRTLLKTYYPREKTMFSVFPAAMRYAGPREAVFHALVRKNFGCTHFIVGRDHAGVGRFYGPWEAQEIFGKFPPEELGISVLFFKDAFFCAACGQMGTEKTCPHPPGRHLLLSGTELRKMLASGARPPEELVRPEIAEILSRHYSSKPPPHADRETDSEHYPGHLRKISTP